MPDIQLGLPMSLDDWGGMKAVYRDMAPSRGDFVFAVYTPEGIHRLDGEYAKRIISFRGTKKQRQALRNEILRDPHLHTVIKQNLVANLDAR